MKSIFKFIVFVLVLLSLSACSFVKGKAEAETFAEAIFQERINRGGFGADQYYSKIFWENTEINEWTNIKKLVTNAMGDLKAYTLSTWNIQSNIKTNGLSGTIVVLQYETEYEKGNGTETLTIHKPLAGKKFSIVGHNFNSDNIQKYIQKGIEQAVLIDS